MKKKLIATLVAGAVLSTGLIGLTACGNKTVKLPTGEKVADAEAWQKAFVDTLDLENYTFEASSSVDMKLEGTVNKNYSPWSSSDAKVKNVDVKYTAKSSAYNLMLLDVENDKAYTEATVSADAKGTTDGVEEKEKYSYTNKEYYELSQKEDLANGKTKKYWNAEYSKSESNGTEGKSSSESYWAAEETTSYASTPMSMLAGLSFYEEDKEDATSKSIVALYDAFKYDGGVYTADLYMATRLGETYASDLVKVTVKVSFSDGHVAGLSYKADKVSDTVKEDDAWNLTYTYSVEAVYALTNVKSTDVSKKVTKDITKALDKAKAEKDDNE